MPTPTRCRRLPTHCARTTRWLTWLTQRTSGASWGFIRKPFLKQAIIVGLISATLTCILLGTIIYGLLPYMPHVQEIMTWHELAFTAACVFIFGFVIMVLCTYLSVNKFLRMTAGELYKI